MEGASRKCFRKKVEKQIIKKLAEVLQVHMQRKWFQQDVDYNTTSWEKNFSKHGFDGPGVSFPLFKVVYVFLEYFFSEHLLNDVSKYLYYMSIKQNN